MEHELLLGGGGSLQLLLDEPGAVLVLGELHNVVGDLPQLKVGVAVVPEIIHMFLFSDFDSPMMGMVLQEQHQPAKLDLSFNSFRHKNWVIMKYEAEWDSDLPPLPDLKRNMH